MTQIDSDILYPSASPDGSPEMAKVIPTPTLRAIAKRSEEAGYNRVLGVDDIAYMDDEILSVVSFAMLHRHIQGREVEPHVRTMFVTVDPTGSTIQLQVDMSIDDYDSLPTVSDVTS